jgi:hypothetical protein
MSQPYGAAISGSSTESGQHHRSGPNFQFLPGLPQSGELIVTITGTPNPTSVKANLYMDVTLGSDKLIANLSQSSSFGITKDVTTSGSYYVADPSGASEDFVVYFSA